MHYYRVVSVALALLLVSGAVAAQGLQFPTAIVIVDAPIYVKPDVNRTPLTGRRGEHKPEGGRGQRGMA